MIKTIEKMNRGKSKLAHGICTALLAFVLACGESNHEETLAEHAPELPSEKEREANNKSNIVWIVLDALRAKNLSAYGYERPTSPVMDALAKEGVLFENAFTQHNQTLYSVPQYLTGWLYPVEGFMSWDWRVLWRQRRESERYISEILSKNGYKTTLFTPHPYFSPETRIWNSFDERIFIWPSAPKASPAHAAAIVESDDIDEDLYFNVFYQQPVTFAEINENFFSWLDKRHSDKPFFAYIHALDTHFPHVLEEPYDRWIDTDSIPERLFMPLPNDKGYTSEESNIMRGMYDGSILYADTQIGVLLEELKKRDLYENSIVIISSDHGEVLAEDGKSIQHQTEYTFDEVYHIPLILKGPNIPGNTRVKNLVQAIDIVPTLVDLLGLETGAAFDGISLAPLLDENDDAVHEFIAATFFSGTYPKMGAMLRNKDSKYIRYPDELEKNDVLFYAPDHIGQRKEIADQSPDLLAKWRDIYFQDVDPRYKAYMNLPLTDEQPFLMAVPWGVRQYFIKPEDAYVNSQTVSEPKSNSDGKWSVHERELTCAGFQEDCKPITITLPTIPEVPITVKISMKSRKGPGQTFGTYLKVKAEDEAEFRMIGFESEREELRFLTIGEYLVTDGKLDITFDEGSSEHWATGRYFKIIPMTGETVPGEDAAEVEKRLESIKSLGYF